MELIGREKEAKELNRLYNSNKPELVAIYGRRRVGKTYLIDTYFADKITFTHTGMSPDELEKIDARKLNSQLDAFYGSLLSQGMQAKRKPKTWIEAFTLLIEFLESKKNGQRRIVFIDELPWLDTPRSNFIPAFGWFWNNYGCKQQDLMVIVCGSATSWMDEKITKNKGGLFNRQTCRLYLEPFTLNETEKFLDKKGINWSRYEIAECYMIMGGIPYYLDLLDSELSLKQNIDNLFFRKKGELWDEFEHLYKTLFTNSDNYVAVVEALSEKRGGLTRNEICKKINSSDGGDLSKVLNNLVLSGFVSVSNIYGRKKKECLYQLSDYYTLFYFKFIKDYYGKDEHYWSNSIDNASRRVWEGLTFERLCKDHVKQIKNALGISGVLSEESSWFVRSDEEKGISGAQIDLVIDRRDHVVSICEMKYSIAEYEIDKTYDINLRNKIASFSKATNCKKTIQLVMITTYGVKRNKYSGVVGTQVVLDDLFK